MQTQSEHHGLTLASKITVCRILGIPVFVLLMIYYTLGLEEGAADERYRMAALGVFAVVALTDALDGYIARSRNQVTHLGAVLDPLADKALLLAALILFTRPSIVGLEPQFPVWFTLLVISRDVFLFIGALLIHMATGHVEVHPRLSGKVATTVQMTAIVCALAGWGGRVFTVLVGAAAAFTFLSGTQYLFDGFRQFERPSRHGHA